MLFQLSIVNDCCITTFVFLSHSSFCWCTLFTIDLLFYSVCYFAIIRSTESIHISQLWVHPNQRKKAHTCHRSRSCASSSPSLQMPSPMMLTHAAACDVLMLLQRSSISEEGGAHLTSLSLLCIIVAVAASFCPCVSLIVARLFALLSLLRVWFIYWCCLCAAAYRIRKDNNVSVTNDFAIAFLLPYRLNRRN